MAFVCSAPIQWDATAVRSYLRKALGKPWGALHFAGEACPPLREVEEYATVHGALASGEHAARAVLAALAQQPR